MGLIEIIGIAIGLAMDASAVSMAASAAGYAEDGRARFRLSFHFGLFQFLMPIVGWALGMGFVSYLKSVDHWIAFLLLSFVGIRMILEGLDRSSETRTKDPSRGMTMVMLSIATSIDAMAVGVSFAMLDVAILYPSIIIGLITSFMCLLAIWAGAKLGRMAGNKMEILGGVVLVFIGARILFSHFLSPG